MSFQKVIIAWKEDAEFRLFYNSILSEYQFTGIYWEHPPMTIKRLDKEYEFIIKNAEYPNKIHPNRNTFSKFFQEEKHVTHFKNLGKDGELVVPVPLDEKSDYTHLGKFVRNAQKNQIDDFWKRVGEIFEKNLSKKPLWLSTAGLGVYWLHIRMDSRPRYYKHKPYKEIIP